MIAVTTDPTPFVYLPIVFEVYPGSGLCDQFAPLLIFPKNGRNAIKHVGHRPIQGNSDRYGNHECFHDNYSGSLISLNVPIDKNGHFTVANKKYSDLIMLPQDAHYTVTLPRQPYEDCYVDVTLSDTCVRFDYHYTWWESADAVFLKRWYRIETQYAYMASKNTIRYRTAQMYTSAYHGAEPPVPNLIWSDSIAWDLYETRDTIMSNKIDIEHLLAVVDNFLSYSLPYYNDQLYWGRLSQDACDNAKAVSQNLVATIVDAKELPTLIKTMKDLLNKKVTPKTISNAYLLYQYAIRPSISDGKEIASALVSRKPKTFRDTYTVRSQMTLDSTDIDGHSWSTHYNLKCYYLQENDALAGLFQGIFSWGMANLESVWDFIPYSFVVDWFWSFGDMLAQQDTRTFISTLPVTSVIQTRCDSTTIQASELPYGRNIKLLGKLTIKRYNRAISARLVPPYVELSKPTNPLNHIVEGTAMLIQAGGKR